MKSMYDVRDLNAGAKAEAQRQLVTVVPERIALLTDRFLPHKGGSRLYYYHLYKNLVTQFPDAVTILTKKVAGWQEFDRLESGEHLRIIRHGRPLDTTKYHELPKMLLPLADTLWLLAKKKIDIIHAGDLYPPGVIALLLKRILQIPYLAYCHGEISQTDRYRYQPLIRNRIYREANAVVVNSEYTRQTLLEIGISDKRIHKISPGVDLEQFQPRPVDPDLVREFGLQNKTVLLTVGRLVSRKNHATMIRAVARIFREVPLLKYLIVGEGPEEAALRTLAKEQGVGDVITFVGKVPQKQLPDFYNLCDLFALPNCKDSSGDVEGFGMVFLEANACGKPVVGGLSGGSADAIVDGVTGYLVHPEDMDQLSETLKRLLMDSALRRQLGSAGLRRAKNEFDWQSRARRLREVSSEIVRRRRRFDLRACSSSVDVVQ